MGVQKKISKKKIFFTFFGPKSLQGKKTKNFTFGILAFGTSKPTFNHLKSLEKPKKMHFASNVSHFWYQGQVFMVRKNMPKNAFFCPQKTVRLKEERGRHGLRRREPPLGNRYSIWGEFPQRWFFCPARRGARQKAARKLFFMVLHPKTNKIALQRISSTFWRALPHLHLSQNTARIRS